MLKKSSFSWWNIAGTVFEIVIFSENLEKSQNGHTGSNSLKILKTNTTFMHPTFKTDGKKWC